MNVLDYLKDINETKEDTALKNAKKYLSKISSDCDIDTLLYSYINEFIKIKGTISNINWYIDNLNDLQPKINNRMIKYFNNTEINEKGKLKDRTEQIENFKKEFCIAYNNFFKYDESEKKIRLNRNIRYYSARLDSIDLTAEQSTAIKILHDFLIDYNKKTFGLYGFAGAGKTTTIVEFVSYLLLNGYLNSVAFTAPTNKAVNVIKSKFKPHLKKIINYKFKRELNEGFNFDNELEFLETHGISIQFMTLHKLMGFKTDYSLSGDVIFIRDKGGSNSKCLIMNYELVIIDECSMINIDTIDNIFNEIRTENKTKNYKLIPKVIFTGDPAQLPPVNENNSSIFCNSIKESLTLEDYIEGMKYVLNDTIDGSSSDLQNRYNLLINDLRNMKTFTMKNVVRSKIGAVTELCYELRKWIKTSKLSNHLNKNKQGLYFFDYEERQNKMDSLWFKKFLESIKNNNMSIIITWTNKQTDIYNNTIRKQIFKHKTQINKYEINDILMLSDFYSLDIGNDFVKQKLYTSEQIKVQDTRKKIVPLNKFEKISNSIIKKMKSVVKIEDQIQKLIEGMNEEYCNDVKLSCWFLRVTKIGEEMQKPMIIVVIDDESIEMYNKIKNETNTIIGKFSKKLLYTYKTTQKQIESAVIKPLWKQWHKIFIEPFANVNYGYSITCHKAQGSSFFDVYIDLDDILKNPKDIEGKKCAYTAATRTSNELNIFV